jgi:hypothetical protein
MRTDGLDFAAVSNPSIRRRHLATMAGIEDKHSITMLDIAVLYEVAPET